jgi:16S rRNA C1402 (ribose-2'-O) methylase RsmI
MYGFLSAGLGSALADILSGYIAYAPATFMIKGLMAVIAFYGFKLFRKKIGKLSSRIISGTAAEIMMILGYFVFEGFLEVKGKEHREAIERLLTEQRTSVLYEAPHRLVKTLTQLNEAGLGGRKLCLGREMTKRYEEFLYMTVSDALAFYQVNEPRGEFVLVLEGRAEAEVRGWVSAHKTDFDAEKFVLASLSAGQKVKTIAQEVAKQSALSSKEAYAYVQELKNRDWKD